MKLKINVQTWGMIFFGYITISLVLSPIIEKYDTLVCIDLALAAILFVGGTVYTIVKQMKDKTFFSKMIKGCKFDDGYAPTIITLLGLTICLIFNPSDWKFWIFLLVLDIIALLFIKIKRMKKSK